MTGTSETLYMISEPDAVNPIPLTGLRRGLLKQNAYTSFVKWPPLSIHVICIGSVLLSFVVQENVFKYSNNSFHTIDCFKSPVIIFLSIKQMCFLALSLPMTMASKRSSCVSIPQVMNLTHEGMLSFKKYFLHLSIVFTSIDSSIPG